MNKNSLLFFQLLILLSLYISIIFTQTAVNSKCPTTCSACNEQNICSRCQDNNFSPQSDCQCQEGQYFSEELKQCQRCNPLCKTCRSENYCLSCVSQQGLAYNLYSKKCECDSKKYITTGNFEDYCQQCYTYGTQCIPKKLCPEGSKINEKYKICQAGSQKNLENTDLVNLIIISALVIAIQIFIAISLYTYLKNRMIDAYEKEKVKTHILSEEEYDFLATRIEKDREIALKDEESLVDEKSLKMRLQQIEKEHKARLENMEKQFDEKRKRQEEEFSSYQAATMAALELKRQKDLKEQEDNEKRKKLQEDEENRIREENFRKRQIELEEQDKRRATEQALLVEKIRQQREEQARLQAEREEEERKKEEERERRRKQLEEQERIKKEEEMAQQIRIREAIKQAKLERKRIKQMNRQKTISDNQAKIQNLRDQRQKMINQKNKIETDMVQMENDADNIDQDFAMINNNIVMSKQNEVEIERIKGEILKTKEELEEKRAQMEEKLQGVNIDAAKQSVDKLQGEDIVFIQSLKNPPERIRLCMEAVLALLKGSCKALPWDEIKKEMSSGGFQKSIYQYDIDYMNQKMIDFIQKQYFNNPQWNVSKMYKASKAAGVFSEWLQSLIEYHNLMSKNKDLFQQVKELELKELQMEGEMQRVKQLDKQVEKEQEDQKQMLNSIDNLKVKQTNLRKSATIKQDEIKFREQEINALRTDNLTLMEVDENQSSEDENAEEILNNL